MRLTSRLLDILRNRFRKPLIWRARIPKASDDPRVTKAIADKIMEDARKHRLSIEGQDDDEDR